MCPMLVTAQRNSFLFRSQLVKGQRSVRQDTAPPGGERIRSLA